MIKPAFVYMITNKVNGKRYIGKTVNPKVRWYMHQRDARQGKGHVIHRALRKYGVMNFEFQVISSHLSEEAAYQAEQETIALLKTTTKEGGYNLNEGGKGSLSPSAEVRLKISLGNMGHPVSDDVRHRLRAAHLGTKHSEDTKAKMSLARKGVPKSAETKRRMSEWQIGKVVSETTRLKIGAANLGHKHSDETKAQMSISHKGVLKTEEHKRKISEAGKRRWEIRRNTAKQVQPC